jgi:hypothetical protein
MHLSVVIPEAAQRLSGVHHADLELWIPGLAPLARDDTEEAFAAVNGMG